MIVNETNKFEWSGPDLYPIKRGISYGYGELPAALLREAHAKFLEQVKERRFFQVNRDFDPQAELEKLRRDKDRDR